MIKKLGFWHYFLGISFIVLLAGILNNFLPYKIIYSPQNSIAVGFYFSKPCSNKDLESRGTMVYFSYKQESWLPKGVVNDYQRLIKYIVGLEGDSVWVMNDATRLCSLGSCRNFKRIETMPINIEEGEIPKGMFFGVGVSDNSFDSRYAGNFKLSSIKGCLVKL